MQLELIKVQFSQNFIESKPHDQSIREDLNLLKSPKPFCSLKVASFHEEIPEKSEKNCLYPFWAGVNLFQQK